jgi:hypothetical protein
MPWPELRELLQLGRVVVSAGVAAAAPAGGHLVVCRLTFAASA